MWCSSILLLLLPLVRAATAPKFKAPSSGPLVPSPNYGHPSNATLPKPTVVPGQVFDRFIQVWLENTDFQTAASSPVFQQLAQQGITLSQFYGVTHPSEPNYIASVGGDFFGMHDDALYHIPSNISTIVDLLAAKSISWAVYEESMLTDGDPAFTEQIPNYLNPSAPPYTYYVRKHDPLIIYDSVASVPSRAALVRNFNDFAADVNASAVPQWVFVTPNMVNDGHDTNIDFIGSWLQFWFIPLLADSRFNDNRTLISLTFDENENGAVNNRIMHLLLGGAVPPSLHGTTDSTFYTHYSALSTVQANWGLGCLGRQDTNKTLANVYSFVAQKTGYQNNNISGNAIPHLNISGTIPGPLNPDFFVPFSPPNTSASCAGGGSVFVASNFNVTAASEPLPPPVNLTAMNQTVPDAGPLPSPTSPSSPSASSRANREAVSVMGAMLGAMLAVAELSL